jgi:hypothetical protein
MTSDSGGEHPADSVSGPSGCPRYREENHSKVQRLDRATLTAIEAHLLEHFNVPTAPFLPEGTQTRERKPCVSSHSGLLLFLSQQTGDEKLTCA